MDTTDPLRTAFTPRFSNPPENYEMTTSTIRDSCIEFFQKEEIKHYVKEILRPIVQIIYNEVYPYIWLICFYSVFLIFLTLANLGLLLWIRTLMVSTRVYTPSLPPSSMTLPPL